MLLWKLILIFLLSVINQVIQAEYYSSISGLEKLLLLEKFVGQSFENFTNAEEQRHTKLLKYIEERENELENASKCCGDFYDNPLNAWKSIRRVRQELDVFNASDLYDKNIKEFLGGLTKYEKLFPSEHDLLGASEGIAVLQRIYNLKALDLANGTILNRKVSPEMSAADCFNLGRSLLYSEDYKNAREWLLETLRRQAQKTQTTDSGYQSRFSQVKVEDITVNLAYAEVKNGNPKLGILLLKDLISRDPHNQKLVQAYQLIEKDVKEQRMLKRSMEIQPKNQTVDKSAPFFDMCEKTCNGQLKRTAREERDLHCHYSHNNVPFCLIAPFKVEILNFDPYVAVYYEAIYENEIQNILKNATQYIERSAVGESENVTISNYRTSKQTWLSHRKKFLAPLLQRLNDITGLSTSSAEQLQVANYGIGGRYGPHFDFSVVGDDYDGTGNRYLTAMFYINKVEMGGATAFPHLKLAVPPIRRSLVMWYNLHSSLDPDYRTLHAGCPVIKGSKWILNEWFHPLNQEFSHPCGLMRDNYKSENHRKIHFP